jgi:hypothetical protein
VRDFREIELRLQADPPLVALIKKAGIHASAILLTRMDEFIHIRPPYKISAKANVVTESVRLFLRFSRKKKNLL